MRDEKVLQLSLPNGRIAIVIVESKKWFIQSSFEDLPEGDKNYILRSIEKVEIIKNLLR